MVGPRDLALRVARTRYDHLRQASSAWLISEGAWRSRGAIEPMISIAGLATERGIAMLRRAGIELGDGARAAGSSSAGPCADPASTGANAGFVIAGRLGAAIYRHSPERSAGARRPEGTRALEILGQVATAGLREVFWGSRPTRPDAPSADLDELLRAGGAQSLPGASQREGSRERQLVAWTSRRQSALRCMASLSAGRRNASQDHLGRSDGRRPRRSGLGHRARTRARRVVPQGAKGRRTAPFRCSTT